MATNVIRTLVGDGIRAPVTNGGTAKTSGKIIVVGELHHLLLKAATANETGVSSLIGGVEVSYAKNTGKALTAGAVVYFDATADEVTTVTTNNKKCGIESVAATTAAATAKFYLGVIR